MAFGSSIALSYDRENHLTGVSGGVAASFAYDGDGKRVKSVSGAAVTAYIGNYYQWNRAAKKYYYLGGQRVAMQDGSNNTFYLLSDHLGSSTIDADTSATRVAELR